MSGEKNNMNDELQKQLAAMLAQMQSAVTVVGDQIPPLVHEKVFIGRIEDTFTLVFCLAVVACGVRLLLFARSKQFDGDDGAVVAATIIGAGVSLIFSILSFVSLHYVLSAWFAPRLYIMEWLADMVKK